MLSDSNKMKTELHRFTALVLVLMILPLFSGCETDEPDSTAGLFAALSGDVAPTDRPATAEPSADPAAPAVSESPAAPAERPVVAGELTLPPYIRPSSSLAEIIKLAQAGVDPAVMLTYVTNSAHTFGLGADEIVYLNDLGIPSGVILAILEHDNAMKQFWANAAQPSAPPAAPEPQVATEPPVAAAPAYETPPAAEPLPAQQQPANVTYNYFYDSLSPYGSWVNVEGYGMCWQPSVVVVNRGWQPYRDGGRWIYTDVGWYWYSDYTWGWAPFHYGRWFTHPRWGWCWYPGYTWGPAWVTWRYTDGYCGWAPLPPSAYYSAGFGFTYHGGSVGVGFGFGLGYDYYTFVPWDRFCNYRPSRYYAPRHHAREIYSQSTVVNNVIIGDNNTIINAGVPVDRVKAATKSDIQKVAVRDMVGTSGRDPRRERLAQDGRTLAVHRPQPPKDEFVRNGPGDNQMPAGRPLTGGRAVDGQPSSPDNRVGQNAEARPLTTRPSRELSTTSDLTPTTVEKPVTRPSQPGTPVREQSAPSATVSKPSPAPRPIDVPSTRPATGLARPSPAETSAAASNRPVRENTVPPLIVRGSERVSGPPPASRSEAPPASTPLTRPAAPSSSSLVVIGKSPSAPAQRPSVVTPPSPQSQPAELARPEPRATAPTATSESQSFSRPAPAQRQFSQPQSSAPPVTRSVTAPSAPQPVQPRENPRSAVRSENSSRPSNTAPVNRPNAPAQTFTPRPAAPAPAPAPPAQFSRPAPAAPTPVSPPPPAPPTMSTPRQATPPSAVRSQPTPPAGNDSRPRSR